MIPKEKGLLHTHPNLAMEWHPTKNGELKPADCTYGSGKKVWWQCENEHEWQATISNRAGNKSGCPYCSGKKAWPGFNDLQTTNPELAQEWHPVKNGNLTPRMVVSRSDKKVWWLCEKGHEWEAAIKDRQHGNGCPYCSGRLPVPGKTDLATVYPDIAKQWHPTKNGKLTPSQMTPRPNKKVWWKCEKGHEWYATVDSRSKTICPICTGRKVLVGYNDLATTHPTIAAQWHPTKNGKLTPQMITHGSTKKTWWHGKCGHEWMQIIKNRTLANAGCPVCSGREVLSGFNDLATKNPEVIALWHPSKNGDLTPAQVTSRSNKKVWWKCEKGHEWEAAISGVSGGSRCPICSNRVVLAGFNDLGTTHPRIASEWHPTLNGELKPQEVSKGSIKLVWWKCAEGHEWKTSPNGRTNSDSGCPVCARRTKKE